MVARNLPSHPLFHFLFCTIQLIAIVAFGIGYRTRVANIILVITGISLYHRNPMFSSHVPLLCNLLLIWSCFLPLNRYWSVDAALTAVMAAKGYPGDYAKGSEIRGIDAAETVEGVKVFHAGTALKDGHLVANGGRVLNVTASAPTIAQAQKRAYQAVDKIDWPEGFCRRDIGWRAVKPRA